MSNDTVTTWVCDRCGRQERTGPADQPITWGRLKLHRPPKSADDAIHNYTFGDICQPCRNALEEWWRGTEAPA